MPTLHKTLCLTQTQHPQVYRVAGCIYSGVVVACVYKDLLPARITEAVAVLTLAGPLVEVHGFGWTVEHPPWTSYYVRLHDDAEIASVKWAISQTPQTEDLWHKPPRPKSKLELSASSSDCAPTISTQ